MSLTPPYIVEVENLGHAPKPQKKMNKNLRNQFIIVTFAP